MDKGIRPEWKVCTAQPRYLVCNFDASYIFSINFYESWVHKFQTFQSGHKVLNGLISEITWDSHLCFYISFN